MGDKDKKLVGKEADSFLSELSAPPPAPALKEKGFTDYAGDALDYAGNALGRLISGATMGVTDRLVRAGADAIKDVEFLDPVERDMRAYLQSQDTFSRQNPYVAKGLEGAGMMLPMLASGGAAAAGRLGVRGLAALGAAEGAAAGLANENIDSAVQGREFDMESAVKQMGTGALLGGAVGGAAAGIPRVAARMNPQQAADIRRLRSAGIRGVNLGKVMAEDQQGPLSNAIRDAIEQSGGSGRFTSAQDLQRMVAETTERTGQKIGRMHPVIQEGFESGRVQAPDVDRIMSELPDEVTRMLDGKAATSSGRSGGREGKRILEALRERAPEGPDALRSTLGELDDAYSSAVVRGEKPKERVLQSVRGAMKNERGRLADQAGVGDELARANSLFSRLKTVEKFSAKEAGREAGASALRPLSYAQDAFSSRVDSGVVSLQEAVARALQSKPGVFGPYSNPLKAAALRGPQALSAAIFTLSNNDRRAREMFNEMSEATAKGQQEIFDLLDSIEDEGEE